MIDHADEETIRRTISEIHRMLRSGGTCQGIMLTHRGLAMTRQAVQGGRDVSSNTWVLDDEKGDKGHSHHFCQSADILRLFEGFEIMKLEDEELDKGRDGHWHLILERH